MADNLATQSVTLATLPSGTAIAARSVTYSGDSPEYVAPTGNIAFAGSDDAKVAFDLGATLSNHLVSLASTNATVVKASAGLLMAVHVYNNAAYPLFVKFHNTATTPTAGSGVVLTIAVQMGQRVDVPFQLGRYFSTGISFTIVKGIADSDTTAVLAADCVVDVDYN